jgi:hypothetical protein
VTRAHHIMALFVLSILAFSSPAYAGKKDTAWAQCLWEQVPTTANNWLSMSSSAGSRIEDNVTTLTPPDIAIEWRLKAACHDLLKAPNKTWPPSFYGKNVKAALVALKPTTIGPDKMEPVGFRCDLYFENDTELKNRAGFDWGVKTQSGETIYSTTRFGFAGIKGGVVQLTEGAGIRKCFRVLADGTMTNA